MVVQRFRTLQAQLGMQRDVVTAVAVCMEQPTLLAFAGPTIAARLQKLKALLRTWNSDQVAELVRACPWVLTQPVGALQHLLGELSALAALRPSWCAPCRGA